MKKWILILFLFSCDCSIMAQQTSDDMSTIQSHINYAEVLRNSTVKNRPKIQKTLNPGKLLLYLPLYGYQRLLSEQISASCCFEPSCSAFSILSIKKLGILKGLFLTADRLTRCNGDADLEAEPYLFDPIKAKVIDEPDMYKSIH